MFKHREDQPFFTKPDVNDLHLPKIHPLTTWQDVARAAFFVHFTFTAFAAFSLSSEFGTFATLRGAIWEVSLGAGEKGGVLFEGAEGSGRLDGE